MTMTRTKTIQRPVTPVLHHNILHITVYAYLDMIRFHSDAHPQQNLYDARIIWASRRIDTLAVPLFSVA